MGRRGPAPESAASKLARGETRPSRVNFEEPLPRQSAPAMPRGMEPEAQAVWRRILRDMAPGVIVSVDGDLLRMFCEAVVDYHAARKLLRTGGPLIRGARGNELVVNPAGRLVRETREGARLLARELGLSPAARAGLRIDLNTGGGDLDAVLGPPPRLRVVGGEDLEG